MAERRAAVGGGGGWDDYQIWAVCSRENGAAEGCWADKIDSIHTASMPANCSEYMFPNMYVCIHKKYKSESAGAGLQLHSEAWL